MTNASYAAMGGPVIRFRDQSLFHTRSYRFGFCFPIIIKIIKRGATLFHTTI